MREVGPDDWKQPAVIIMRRITAEREMAGTRNIDSQSISRSE